MQIDLDELFRRLGMLQAISWQTEKQQKEEIQRLNAEIERLKLELSCTSQNMR